MKRLQTMMHIREEIVYCGNTKYHMREYQKRKQTNLFPGMSRKRNKERRKEIPETDPDPSTQVTVLPESQRIFTQLTQW